MRMSRRTGVSWVVAVAIVISLLYLAGCQGGKNDSLENIKKAGHIRIAMGLGYPPFCYYNARQELAGFDVGVARELAKRMGVDAKLIAVDSRNIIGRLNTGDYDTILGSMAITEERAKLVDFSIPYYHARSQIMVSKHSPFKTIKDLKGKTIGVMEESTFKDDAEKLGAGCIRQYRTNNDALAALEKREVDAVVTDDVVGMYGKNRIGFKIENLGDTLSYNQIAIAVRKGDVSLLRKINAVIGEMRTDGTIGQLVERISHKHDEPTLPLK
ncbi:MAG: transporter substrate-binding domain-containing protein [Syntrophobacterales bacterium]|jgi:polar amino acid transport system substrate-binding protein|nr:transporter substrate-binding domain-containing protein [Syntrophobacterales bacterium]